MVFKADKMGRILEGEEPQVRKLHLMHNGLYNFIILKCMPICEEIAILITIIFALSNAKGERTQ